MTESKESFDKVAEEYDRYRSGYDDRVIADIKRISSLQTNSVVCEIGPGTGQATVAFAPDVKSLVCVELGVNLSARLKHNMSAYKNVRVLTYSFEEAPLGSDEFDLVFAAQSFGWIDPQIGYPKIATILKPGGWFAAFWKRLIPNGTEGSSKSTKLIQEYVPDFTSVTPQQHEEDALHDLSELVNCELFKVCQLRRYPYVEKPSDQSPEERAASLGTWSRIAALEKADRDEFVTRMSEIYKTEIPEQIEKETVLIIGQKRR